MIVQEHVIAVLATKTERVGTLFVPDQAQQIEYVVKYAGIKSWVKPGDKVVFVFKEAIKATIEGQEYIFIKDEHVLAVINA